MTVTKVMDKLNKKHQVTEVDVIFSGAVNAAEADSMHTYRLATPGKKGSYTAKNAGIIKLKKALYTPSTNTVALTPKKPFALTKPVQVLVYGTGATALQDAQAATSTATTTALPAAMPSRSSPAETATIDTAAPIRAEARRPLQPHRRHRRRLVALPPTPRIDALLHRGELTSIRRTRQTRRSAQAIASVTLPHASGLSRS